jgi:hypothetical protein
MRYVDSLDYDILVDAVKKSANVDINALSCEIGVRAGGSSAMMIDALVKSAQAGRTHLLLDPWGNIEYLTSENSLTRHDYSNTMRNVCMSDLYQHIESLHGGSINVLPFVMEDTEFFERFADGVPIYSNTKRIANTYSVVHFDGPHAFDPLVVETEFFIPRLLPGSTVVYDDVGNYDHAEFERWLLPQGFKVLQRGDRKISYTFGT